MDAPYKVHRQSPFPGLSRRDRVFYKYFHISLYQTHFSELGGGKNLNLSEIILHPWQSLWCHVAMNVLREYVVHFVLYFILRSILAIVRYIRPMRLLMRNIGKNSLSNLFIGDNKENVSFAISPYASFTVNICPSIIG